MDDRGPSPDALPREAEHTERGKLLIFLGAAPGVGKTYETLSVAQTRRRQGIDVVIGVVETHGRQDVLPILVGVRLPEETFK
jgi:two-component system sensor histidine kinase KdpD